MAVEASKHECVEPRSTNARISSMMYQIALNGTIPIYSGGHERSLAVIILNFDI